MQEQNARVPSVDGLKGQQRQAAEALVTYGYLDLEYALNVLKIRSLPEIIRRLRLKGWPITTHEDQPKRLYTLTRNLKQDVRLITTAINEALALGDANAAYRGVIALEKRLRPQNDA